MLAALNGGGFHIPVFSLVTNKEMQVYENSCKQWDKLCNKCSFYMLCHLFTYIWREKQQKFYFKSEHIIQKSRKYRTTVRPEKRVSKVRQSCHVVQIPTTLYDIDVWQKKCRTLFKCCTKSVSNASSQRSSLKTKLCGLV